jgi:hypothetical protein
VRRFSFSARVIRIGFDSRLEGGGARRAGDRDAAACGARAQGVAQYVTGTKPSRDWERCSVLAPGVVPGGNQCVAPGADHGVAQGSNQCVAQARTSA